MRTESSQIHVDNIRQETSLCVQTQSFSCLQALFLIHKTCRIVTFVQRGPGQTQLHLQKFPILERQCRRTQTIKLCTVSFNRTRESFTCILCVLILTNSESPLVCALHRFAYMYLFTGQAKLDSVLQWPLIFQRAYCLPVVSVTIVIG